MLALPASLTVYNASAALRTLAEGISSEAGDVVVIDASALAELDTSAVATLLECRRVAQTNGRCIELRSVPAKLADLARLYGVAELIGVPAPGASSGAVC